MIQAALWRSVGPRPLSRQRHAGNRAQSCDGLPTRTGLNSSRIPPVGDSFEHTRHIANSTAVLKNQYISNRGDVSDSPMGSADFAMSDSRLAQTNHISCHTANRVFPAYTPIL